MKINSIRLLNFLPFKGEQTIEFSKGLNIINGNIGSGKSNLFNSFYWCLFNKIYITDEGWDQNPDLFEIVNASALESINEGEDIEFGVYIDLETNNVDTGVNINYTISRTCTLFKENQQFRILKTDFDLYYVDPDYGSTHHSNNEASNIIDLDIFPEILSDYVWFQGESIDKLIDLEKSESFRNVVDTISYIDYYEDILEVLKLSEKKIDREYRKKLNKSTKDKKRFQEIDFELTRNEKIIENNECKLANIIEELDKYKLKREELKEKLYNKDETEELIKRRDNTETSFKLIIQQIESLDEDYKRKFIDKWMLKGLSPLIKLSLDKMTNFEEWRTNEIDKEQNLPEDVPGDQYLHKMIKEELCMICNREAKEGTPEHLHIRSLLNRKEKSKVLSPEIENLNSAIIQLKHFPSILLNKISLVDDEIKKYRKEDSELITQRNFLLNEKNKIEREIKDFEGKIGSSVDKTSINTRRIIDEINKYDALISKRESELKQNEKETRDSKNKIEILKAELKSLESNDESEITESKQLNVINSLKEAIEKTIDVEYKKLIKDIEERSNKYINDILSHNSSIKAKIEIDPSLNTIEIVDKDGEELNLLNTGHKTIIKMSIINSIISKSSEYKNQPYPFVTDAPTSSLGEKDTISYLKLVSEIFDQSIVMSKDLFGNMEDIRKTVELGSVYELSPMKIDETKESTLKNTYTIINKG